MLVHVLGAGGGVLTDKWYTGMLKGFEVHFRKFWYIDGWVIVTYPMRPICTIECILKNLAKKAPNLPQIGCFLQKNGIEMVTKTRFSRYRDGRNFKLYFEHPRKNFFWRTLRGSLGCSWNWTTLIIIKEDLHPKLKLSMHVLWAVSK